MVAPTWIRLHRCRLFLQPGGEYVVEAVVREPAFFGNRDAAGNGHPGKCPVEPCGDQGVEGLLFGKPWVIQRRVHVTAHE